jgi:transposase-like protein
MSKLNSDASIESAWRNHLTHHAASGKSISAFCREEGITQSNFYTWRSRLGVASVMPAPRLQKLPTSFIDLGVVKGSTTHTPLPQASIEVRTTRAADCYSPSRGTDVLPRRSGTRLPVRLANEHALIV